MVSRTLCKYETNTHNNSLLSGKPLPLSKDCLLLLLWLVLSPPSELLDTSTFCQSQGHYQQKAITKAANAKNVAKNLSPVKKVWAVTSEEVKRPFGANITATHNLSKACQSKFAPLLFIRFSWCKNCTNSRLIPSNDIWKWKKPRHGKEITMVCSARIFWTLQ